jgi:MFS family permease
MGYIGDVLGRNKAMILTVSMGCLAAAASAVLPRGSPTSVYIVIIISRFVLGAGLGGVYPLSAAKAAEDGSADEEQQSSGCISKDGDESKEETGDPAGGPMTDSKLIDAANALENMRAGTRRSALAFVWQVPGSMTPWALAYIFSFYSFEVDTQWRLLLGLGSIPSAIAVLLQITEMEWKKRNSAITDVNSDIAVLTEESRKTVIKEKLDSLFHNAFRDRIIWFKVLYTGGSWFIYDVCFCKLFRTVISLLKDRYLKKTFAEMLTENL